MTVESPYDLGWSTVQTPGTVILGDSPVTPNIDVTLAGKKLTAGVDYDLAIYDYDDWTNWMYSEDDAPVMPSALDSITNVGDYVAAVTGKAPYS